MIERRTVLRSTPALLLVLLAAACARQDATTTTSEPHAGAPVDTAAAAVAVATLSPTQGHQVTGTVTFTEEPGGVRILAEVNGLTPGEHGIHIHENADCSAPDAASAGDHWNPTGASHAGPDDAQRHLGDLGNITADASGHGHLERFQSGLTLQGGTGVVGHSVIVHAQRDDFTTQPSGNAGARVACGAIALQP